MTKYIWGSTNQCKIEQLFAYAKEFFNEREILTVLNMLLINNFHWVPSLLPKQF